MLLPDGGQGFFYIRGKIQAEDSQRAPQTAKAPTPIKLYPKTENASQRRTEQINGIQEQAAERPQRERTADK